MSWSVGGTPGQLIFGWESEGNISRRDSLETKGTEVRPKASSVQGPSRARCGWI